MKIRFLAPMTFFFCLANALGAYHVIPAKIKHLDLDFSCNSKKITSADECYYLGLQQIHKLGCHVTGTPSSSNCDERLERVEVEGVPQELSSEWVCSIPSDNCKQTDNDDCALGFKLVSLRKRDVLGNGKVVMHFLTVCVLDSINGRKDPGLIVPNTPMTAP